MNVNPGGWAVVGSILCSVLGNNEEEDDLLGDIL
jgi:hypothetical protein